MNIIWPYTAVDDFKEKSSRKCTRFFRICCCVFCVVMFARAFYLKLQKKLENIFFCCQGCFKNHLGILAVSCIATGLYFDRGQRSSEHCRPFIV